MNWLLGLDRLWLKLDGLKCYLTGAALICTGLAGMITGFCGVEGQHSITALWTFLKSASASSDWNMIISGWGFIVGKSAVAKTALTTSIPPPSNN
jgi:hypothetical protein